MVKTNKDIFLFEQKKNKLGRMSETVTEAIKNGKIAQFSQWNLTFSATNENLFTEQHFAFSHFSSE